MNAGYRNTNSLQEGKTNNVSALSVRLPDYRCRGIGRGQLLRAMPGRRTRSDVHRNPASSRAEAFAELQDFTLAGMDRRLGPGYASYHRQGPAEKFPEVWMPPARKGPASGDGKLAAPGPARRATSAARRDRSSMCPIPASSPSIASRSWNGPTVVSPRAPNHPGTAGSAPSRPQRRGSRPQPTARLACRSPWPAERDTGPTMGWLFFPRASWPQPVRSRPEAWSPPSSSRRARSQRRYRSPTRASSCWLPYTIRRCTPVK